MKYLFISDLHLGSPLLKDYATILDLLSGPYDMIFLVGDIIDTWEKSANSIVNDPMTGTIIETINDVSKETTIIFIQGNHDPDLSELVRIFPNVQVLGHRYIFNTGDSSIVVIHGHEFNATILKYNWVAKLVWPLQWLLERVGLNLRGWLRTLLHSISAKKKNKNYNDIILDIEEQVIKMYKEYNYIIMGHTHLPKLVKRDSRPSYVNCGDFIYNQTWVEYDSDIGDITLHGKINM